MNLWLVIVAAGVGSYVFRVSFVALFGRVEAVPPRVKRTLAFVPPAVLAALVFPELLLRDGALSVSLANERLLAGGVAAVVAWYTEDIFATVVVGMFALYAITYLVEAL